MSLPMEDVIHEMCIYFIDIIYIGIYIINNHIYFAVIIYLDPKGGSPDVRNNEHASDLSNRKKK